MKKLFLGLIAVVALQVLNAQSINNVAIVSIYCNEEVGTSFGDVVSVGGFSFKAEDKGFSPKEQLDKYHQLMFGELQEAFPFSFVDESTIITTDDYKNFTYDYSGGDETSGFLAADGYRAISKLRTDEVEALIAKFEGVDALLIVELKYYLQPNTAVGYTGMGNAKGEAMLRLRMYDKNGKKILKQNSYGKGTTTVGVSLNSVSEKSMDKVPTTVVEAADALLIDVKADLPKKIAKMYKKIK